MGERGGAGVRGVFGQRRLQRRRPAAARTHKYVTALPDATEGQSLNILSIMSDFGPGPEGVAAAGARMVDGAHLSSCRAVGLWKDDNVFDYEVCDPNAFTLEKMAAKDVSCNQRTLFW